MNRICATSSVFSSLCLASSASNSLSSGARSASVVLPSCSLALIFVFRAFRSSCAALLSAASPHGKDQSRKQAAAAARILVFIRGNLEVLLVAIKFAKHGLSPVPCQTNEIGEFQYV